MKQVTAEGLVGLSLQGMVAFAARCAMRVRRLYHGPSQQEVDRAIEVARQISLGLESGVRPSSAFMDAADAYNMADSSAALAAACAARAAAAASREPADAALAAHAAADAARAAAAAVNEGGQSLAAAADIAWLKQAGSQVTQAFYDRDLWEGSVGRLYAAGQGADSDTLVSVPPALEIYIDRGEATSADVEEFLVALNELNISFGGQGFEFVTDGTALARQVQQ